MLALASRAKGVHNGLFSVNQGTKFRGASPQPSQIRPYYATPIRVPESLLSRLEATRGLSQKPIEVDAPSQGNRGNRDVGIVPALMRERQTVQGEGLQRGESIK